MGTIINHTSTRYSSYRIYSNISLMWVQLANYFTDQIIFNMSKKLDIWSIVYL